FCVKTRSGSNLEIYAAESKGLEAIIETESLRVPTPQYYGYMEDHCFFILEYIELFTHNVKSMKALGLGLAKMHHTEGPTDFGFDVDNTIGGSPQENQWTESWIEFYKTHRLKPMFKFIQDKYGDTEILQKGHLLLKRLDAYFEGIEVKPSLLHGDFWSGNTAADSEGNPVVFDPAAYYGHHEADLSMTTMFGGFTPDFYEAYHSVIPMEDGFIERQQVYQLYHYLNHYLLFGAGYRSTCIAILDGLI
ncbi:MAG: fructosamine kinase family protein, partial [Chlamydiota bacterium]|nr:fructosamine kinase family protein [Chlamydiota bacterium]